MTAEMIAKVSTIATRWTKNGMDRLYINIDDANELYTSIEDRAHGQLTMNRRERSTGKIWIEVESGEICTKGIIDSDEVVSEIEEIIAYLCPAPADEETAETETAETIKEDTTMTAIKFAVTLSNGYTTFDNTETDTILDACKWAEGRGGQYKMFISVSGGDNEIVAVSINGEAASSKQYASIYDGEDWHDYTRRALVKHLEEVL